MVDQDGDSAVDTLVIDIIDDAPIAVNDTDSLAAGQYGPATGNVITDAAAGDAGDSDNGKDNVGADDASVTAVSGFGGSDNTPSGPNGELTVNGQYGVLTINADGSYSYVRNPGTPGGVSDVFTYTLTDGDGDNASATLTITIADSPTSLDAPDAGEAGTVVDEKGLPTRNGGEPAGTGEAADGNGADNDDPSEATSGIINFTAPDGPATVSIDGVTVTGVIGQSFAGTYGTLVITSYNAATGQIGYTYTLADNTSGNNTSDDFAIKVVDQDGDSAVDTLVIDIIDDAPDANNDVDTVAGGSESTDGNVISGAGTVGGTGGAGSDLVGADNSSVTAASGFGGSDNTPTGPSGELVVNGQYGTLTINADGSYEYVRFPGGPGGVSDVFTYTLTDGDGDTSNATLTINVEDNTPRLATPATALLDDDAVPGAGGNPGTAPVNDDVDSQNTSGTLAGSGGDGDLDYAFTGVNNLPAGFSIDPSSTATVLKIAQGGTVVLTITLNLETGDYTVVQNAPIDHEAGNLENNFTFQVGVKVIDSDGDSATSSLTINVDDDTPLASADSDTVAAGGTTATGNVITDAAAGDAGDSDSGADSPGADGFDGVVEIHSNGTGQTDTTFTAGQLVVAGTYGSLSMDANGNYTYTRGAGTPGGVSEVFTYTYKDGDGDTVTTTLTINIADAAPNLADPALIRLDDDVIPGRNGNLDGPGDDDPDTVPGNVANGQLNGTGGDGDLDYAFTGLNTLPTGFSIGAGSDADTLLIVQDQNGSPVTVLTIQLDLETGAFSVTQNNPIWHPADNGGPDDNIENNFTFQIGVQVVDADNDVEPATITINVDDDTPTVTNTQLTGTVDEDGVVEGSADAGAGDGIAGGTGDVAGEDVTANGNVSSLFSIGADGLGSYSLLNNFAGLTAQGLTSGGVALSYSLGFAGGVYTLTATAGPGGETVFTFTLNAASGAYTFTLVDQLDHPNGGNENELTVNLSSIIQATDADGDSVTAGSTGLIITVDDDTPTASDVQLTGTVDEDGVVENATAGVQAGDGIAGGIAGDVAGENTVLNGSFASLFNTGADAPLTYGLSANFAGLLAQGLTSGGNPLSYGVALNAGVYTLTATAGGQTIFTLTLNVTTGAYTFTLVDQLDHPTLDGLAGDNSENDLLINLSSVIFATDRDGDTVAAGSNAFVVTVDDDMPSLFDPEAIGTGELFNQAGSSATADLDVDANINNNVGADEPGFIQFANIVQGGDSGFTSGGDAIEYWYSNNGTTLQARINSTNGSDGTLIFTVQLNQGAGTYTVTMAGEIDNGSGVSFDNLTSTKAGNVDVRGVGADDPATTVDLLLTASKDGNNATINTDNDSLGSDNQSMNAGETVRVDFVTNLQINAALPSGFSYDGHVGTQSLLQTIPQVQGAQNQTVAFRVYALNTTVTDAAMPDDIPTGPGDGWDDASIVPVTHVTIDGYNDGPDDGTPNEPAVTVALLGVGVWTPIAYGVFAQLQADGSVIFTGVQEGDKYGIETGSDFNAFAVTSLDANVGPPGNQSTTNAFDLGVFAIGQVDSGDPINLTFDLQLTDADGDTVVVDDALQVQIDPAVAPLTLNTLSSTMVSSDSELQRSTANSNTLTISAAVAAAVMTESSVASVPEEYAFKPGVESFEAANDDGGVEQQASGDSESGSVGDQPDESAAGETGRDHSGGRSQGDDHRSDSSLDAAANQQSHDDHAANQAANDGGSTHADAPAAAIVAPLVSLPPAELLQAAGLNGNGHGLDAVAKVIADALGSGGSPTVDGLLAGLSGGGHGPVESGLSLGASLASGGVQSWDMGGDAASTTHSDMLMKVGAMALHHDAVQPTVNG